MKNKITTMLNVQDNLINVMRVNNVDYISLTDLEDIKIQIALEMLLLNG